MRTTIASDAKARAGRRDVVRPGRRLAALGVVAAAALASVFPDTFLLTRDGLLGGEAWRLWTGHLVHASAAHFALDVGAAALLVALGGGRALVLLAPLVGAGALMARPDLASYAGLSGILHAAAVLVAARLARETDGPLRLAAWGVAAGVLAKAALETVLGRALFTSDVDLGGVTVFAAHLIGALTGWIAVLFESLADGRRRGLTIHAAGTEMASCSSPGCAAGAGAGSWPSRSPRTGTRT